MTGRTGRLPPWKALVRRPLSFVVAGLRGNSRRPTRAPPQPDTLDTPLPRDHCATLHSARATRSHGRSTPVVRTSIIRFRRRIVAIFRVSHTYIRRECRKRYIYDTYNTVVVVALSIDGTDNIYRVTERNRGFGTTTTVRTRRVTVRFPLTDTRQRRRTRVSLARGYSAGPYTWRTPFDGYPDIVPPSLKLWGTRGATISAASAVSRRRTTDYTLEMTNGPTTVIK